MWHRATLALLGLLAAGAAQAQETYNINLKKLGKGDSIHVEKNAVEIQSMKVADGAGKEVNNKEEKTVKSMIFQETVLERADIKKKATALKRTYEKATMEVDKNPMVLPYQGKTILIEKKEGVYSYRYEDGGQITGEDAKYLDEEFKQGAMDIDMEAMMLPTTAVAVNAPWKIPMAEFLKAFEKEAKIMFVTDKVTGTGKLSKVYKKDGRQYGDLHFSLELPVRALPVEGAGEIPCQPGSLMKLEMQGYACIDGSLDDSRGTWKMQFDGAALFPSADNPTSRISWSMTREAHSKATEILKK